MPKILVTAFEPFGFRNTPFLRRNASQEILAILLASAEPDLVSAVLPVSSDSEHRLATVLERERPDGVLLLGEQLVQGPASINIEPYAIDTPLSVLPQMGGLQKIVASPFATRISARKSSIQTQQCNRCYLAALRWAEGCGARPVVFVHVPVLGDRADHARQAAEVLAKLRAEAGRARA